MNEYQKERINSIMRSQWESSHSHMIASSNPLISENEKTSHTIRAVENLGYANGMREVLEILGYSIHYEDFSIPQVE